MDVSLYKRMGVHDGRMDNEHLYGMPNSWKSETGRDASHSDKSCIKHASLVDKPNMQYYSEGGDVCAEKGSRRKRLAVGAVAKVRKGQY